MSKLQKRMIRCHECGKEFEVTIYNSINTELNPELAKKVHDATIFDVQCPYCKAQRFLNYPCLYHDQKNNFMVQLESYSNLIRFEKDYAETNKSNPLAGIMSKAMKDYKIVGATSFPEWLTTIVCLENNLDWRVAKLTIREYLKRASQKESNGIKTIDYFFMDGRKNQDGKLVITVGINNEREVHPTFPLNSYNGVLEALKESLDFNNPFVFEDEEIASFMHRPLNEYKYLKPKEVNVFHVRNADDDVIFCNSISKINKRIKPDEYVRVELKGGKCFTGFVIDVVTIDSNRWALEQRAEGTIIEKLEW